MTIVRAIRCYPIHFNKFTNVCTGFLPLGSIPKAFSITELIFNYATIERPVTKTTPTVGMPLSCRFLPDIDGTKSANETGILFCFSLARVYFLLSLYYIVILNL